MTNVMSLSDTEWESKRNEYRRRISTITIPVEITPGIAKGLLSRIDSIYTEARFEYGDVEGQKEKIEDMIKEFERSHATGSNESERKRNAVNYVRNFQADGEVINLYHVKRQLTERSSFLKGALDILGGKHSRIITVSAIMKIEKELSPYSVIPNGRESFSS